MKPSTAFEYDEFLAFMEEAREQLGPVNYVACRSVEEATAFAYWCMDNGIEEPQIVIF